MDDLFEMFVFARLMESGVEGAKSERSLYFVFFICLLKFRNRERIQKNLTEMEELKRNREARDAAREDLEMIKRDEERRHNSNWNITEEGFLLSQSKLRSQIRLKEGRAKPIDFLARFENSVFSFIS